MNHTEEIGQVLFKSRGNTAIVLQSEKEVFNQMPVFVNAFVIGSGLFAFLRLGTTGTSPLSLDRSNECLAVIPYISEDITVLQIEQADQTFRW